MHVARNRRTYVAKSGEERVYESVLLRRTHRDGGKVKHQTLANLGRFPPQVVDTIEAALKGAQLVPAGEAIMITRSFIVGEAPSEIAKQRRGWHEALLSVVDRHSKQTTPRVRRTHH